MSGGADYKKLVPPNSVINVNDFKSPLELANYLHQIVKNPKLYQAYQTWRDKYYVTPNRFSVTDTT